MKCPFCAATDDRVIDSRTSAAGSSIRRRRECQVCERRFTTYERIEEVPRLVVKKDQRREPFNRSKVLSGLLRACEKRPVPLSRLEQLVDVVERRINEEYEFEVDAHTIGQFLAEELKEIDQVAFVRFASVYQEFSDVREFLRELEPLIDDTPLIDRDAARRPHFVEGGGRPATNPATDPEVSGERGTGS